MALVSDLTWLDLTFNETILLLTFHILWSFDPSFVPFKMFQVSMRRGVPCCVVYYQIYHSPVEFLHLHSSVVCPWIVSPVSGVCVRFKIAFWVHSTYTLYCTALVVLLTNVSKFCRIKSCGAYKLRWTRG